MVLAVAVALVAPESSVRARVSLDVPGAVLLGLGLASLLLAISQGQSWGWTSARVVALFAVAAVALVLFVVTESRRADPLVDLALVRARPFVNVNLCAFAFGFAFFIGVIRGAADRRPRPSRRGMAWGSRSPRSG